MAVVCDICHKLDTVDPTVKENRIFVSAPDEPNTAVIVHLCSDDRVKTIEAINKVLESLGLPVMLEPFVSPPPGPPVEQIGNVA